MCVKGGFWVNKGVNKKLTHGQVQTEFVSVAFHNSFVRKTAFSSGLPEPQFHILPLVGSQD